LCWEKKGTRAQRGRPERRGRPSGKGIIGRDNGGRKLREGVVGISLKGGGGRKRATPGRGHGVVEREGDQASTGKKQIASNKSKPAIHANRKLACALRGSHNRRGDVREKNTCFRGL